MLIAGITYRKVLLSGEIYGKGAPICVQMNAYSDDRSMLHDETVYPEPSRFRPERYLNDRGTLRALERAEDPSVIAFGFGRRYISSFCSLASLSYD